MTRTLTTHQLAAQLGITPQTLRRWRMDGRGPRYARLGGPRSMAVYREADVDDWLESRLRSSTSDEAARAATAAVGE